MSKQNFTPAILVLALTAFFNILPAAAQKGGPAVEQWKSYLPYNRVTGIATDGTTFFCATSSGFFTYNREDGTLSSYSKVNGMSDVGLTNVAYDPTTRTTVLTYDNSNIDLFRDNGFRNLPDLKNDGSIAGDKTIHNVIAANGLGYLSTGVGLMIINLNKTETKTTIEFYSDSLRASVNAAILDDQYLYAATSVGLFRIAKNDPRIQSYTYWDSLDNHNFKHLSFAGGVLYAADSNNLYRLSGNTVSLLEHIAFPIVSLSEGSGGALWILADSTKSEDGSPIKGFGILRRPDGSRADSFASPGPSQLIELANGEVWFGDQADYHFRDKNGLRKKTGVTQSEAYIPNGPVTNSSYDVSAYDGEFWVAHGAKSSLWAPQYNTAMFSHYINDNWNNQSWVSPNPFVLDFVRILKDRKTGNLYGASLMGGLFEQLPNGQMNSYGEGYVDVLPGSPNTYMVTGLALDDNGTLWMTNYGSLQHELVGRTSDGRWLYSRSVDGNPGHTAADVIIDDYGQKWFIAVGNGGVIVYNDQGTENNADDQYRIYRSGAGSGNLPDNNTLSLAKDKDGAIWVGTGSGIGVINCADQALDPSCQAELKVVQSDQFAGYLFMGQSVKAIAVDGANRKWVGTTNGVWLLSDDAEKTIYRFTVDNSPLPSNTIERINIDPYTGDVYFSTDKGLIAFRSTATEGKAENDDKLYVYPNPVPSGYNGMIAVRGVAENADVRFTDISGQLVYRTKALGGQAVWNGKDYNGRRAQSGVYLVFVVNKDGTQKATGKFILQN